MKVEDEWLGKRKLKKVGQWDCFTSETVRQLVLSGFETHLYLS